MKKFSAIFKRIFISLTVLVLFSGLAYFLFKPDWNQILYNSALHGELKEATKAVNHGARVNYTNPAWEHPTALYVAVSMGNTSIVRYLLGRGANPSVRDESGNTPLIMAAQNLDPEIAQILLAAGAKANEANNNGVTPLFYAAEGSDPSNLRLVELLLANGADINIFSRYGDTPLTWAEHEAGHLITPNHYDNLEERKKSYAKIISLLWRSPHKDLLTNAEAGNLAGVAAALQVGAYIEARDKYGYTALILAAQNGHTDLLRYLLDRKADVNPLQCFGISPLLAAVREEHLDCVKILVQAGANLNAENELGETPFRTSVLCHNCDIMRFLMQAGVNINRVNKNGETALMKAMFAKDETPLKILIDAGADLEKFSDLGENALMKAAHYGLTDAVKILLGHGANVNAMGKKSKGETALMSSVRLSTKNTPEIIKLLLDAGAKLDAGRTDGKTALMMACDYGNLEGVRSLLMHGATIDIKDKEGRTALDYARASGNKEIIALLSKGKSNSRQ